MFSFGRALFDSYKVLRKKIILRKIIFFIFDFTKKYTKKKLKLVESLHILKLFNFYIEEMKEMKRV